MSPVRHAPQMIDAGVVCSCGRDDCPNLAQASPLVCAAPRRHALARTGDRCAICSPATDGSDAPLAWALAVELAGAGRHAAIARAAVGIRAGRTTAYLAGEALGR